MWGSLAFEPRADASAYTLDHLAEVIERFTEKLRLARYALYVFDYGAPVGFRLARRARWTPTRASRLQWQTLSASRVRWPLQWRGAPRPRRARGREMWIAEIWRYPVKSMAGEALREAALGEDGIAGDRVVHVRGANGRVLTSRTYPALLGHRATLAAAGTVLVDGRPWTDPTVGTDVRRAAGAGARLVRSDALDRFDVLPLLVATDGAVAAIGKDRRRFRPNILVGGVEGLTERSWEGRVLRMGECLVAVQDLRRRCVMTTFDPDSLAQGHRRAAPDRARLRRRARAQLQRAPRGEVAGRRRGSSGRKTVTRSFAVS